jgi:hypothetical protein
MDSEKRQLLYDKLMEGICEEVLIEMAEYVNRDLDKIEPLIDAMLEEALAARATFTVPIGSGNMEIGFSIIPDGTSCIVDLRVGNKSYEITIDRLRMKNLGEFLIEASSQ